MDLTAKKKLRQPFSEWISVALEISGSKNMP
jgi:hypothetical protein